MKRDRVGISDVPGGTGGIVVGRQSACLTDRKTQVLSLASNKLGVVAHASDSSCPDVESGGPEIQTHLLLHSKFDIALG